MSVSASGTRRIIALLRPLKPDLSVCRSRRGTIVQRNYGSVATASTGDSGSSLFPSISKPDLASTPLALNPVYAIKAGVVLSRPPRITRDLTPFEKAYYFYQRRLNERLALPFTRYFYFKRGTPVDEAWKQKYKERKTPARDIGEYDAYSKEAWNDELLVGAIESEPEHQIEMLVRDAETSSGSQEGSKKEDVPRPYSRVTQADNIGDQRSLSRLLQRTLYLLVQSKEGYWKFPSSQLEERENLRTAAERTLAQSTGENMNVWMVGHQPIGHYVYNLRKPKNDEVAKTRLLGEKTFFMKGRIMAGQADLISNTQDLGDFKWLAKEEIEQHVQPQYFSSIRNVLSE